MHLKSIEKAAYQLQKGGMVILVDDECRENEGDLVAAAGNVTAETINFMTKYGRGLVCLSLMPECFDRLGIPMMVEHNRSRHRTAFGVSIGAAHGITTGISAHDRAHTIRVAASPHSAPHDIVMPGHVFPLRASEGGVLVRRGHSEGSTDLVRLAGLYPAAVICEIMNEDGSMARMPDLERFAKAHQLPIVSIQDLVKERLEEGPELRALASARLPIREIDGLGDFHIHVFRNPGSHLESVALAYNVPELLQKQPRLVRIHSECLTGDVFASSRCDCGQQMWNALKQIAQEGGVLLYLRQEGRGIGLCNKIKAYALQDQGYDTVEANHQLGFDADERDYTLAVQMLKALKIKKLRLLTNNPQKISALEAHGIEVVERVPLETRPTGSNFNYLKAKRDKLGHWLNLESVGEN